VSQVIEASAADTSGIRDVTLSYRVVGDADWISAPMTLVGPTWRATIPARNIVSPGIEYYLTATDNAPAANRATLPASAPAVVYAVDVTTPDTAGPTVAVTRYTEPVAVGVDLPFTATVTDPSGVASVTLHWRQTGTTTFAQLAMTPAGGDSFAATIPGSLVDEAGIEYWVSAVDASAAANTATAPASAPTTVYTVETFVAEDTDAPVIVVTEVTSPQPADTGVVVVADVTDASEIVSVILYARAEADADWSIVDMEPLEADTYSAVIDATVVTEGTVYYYVLAEDSAGNVALEPLTAPTETFSFSVLPIEQIDTTPPTITHVPASELVANADATIEVLVTDASGVNSVTVYYTSGSVADAVSVTAANESDDTWVAIIPASDVTGELLSYYIVADDLAVAGNVGTLPSDAPTTVFSVALVQGGGDTGLDAGNDAGPDSGTDAGTDAGDTTSADVTPDAETDAGSDVTVDGSSDSGAGSDPSGSGSGNSSGGGCSATATSRATPVTLGLMLAAMLLVHRRRRVCRG
jgi:MYXO-CTERM domain-containing protein